MKDTHTSRPSDFKEDTNKITTCCINTDDNGCTKHSTVMRNVKKKKRYWGKTTRGPRGGSTGCLATRLVKYLSYYLVSMNTLPVGELTSVEKSAPRSGSLSGHAAVSVGSTEDRQ